MTSLAPTSDAAHRAQFVHAALPPGGLFAGQVWRTALTPFPLGRAFAEELDSLGRVLLQFYRAANLLHRQSTTGKRPAWIAALLDQGKPRQLLELQLSHAFKNELPRVIRPDLLLTDDGFSITELDSVPGGIGLTAWLNQTYSTLPTPHAAAQHKPTDSPPAPLPHVIGGPDGMAAGFDSIFDQASHVHIVVSDEAATYRPEMEWLAARLGSRFTVHGADFADVAPGAAVYRFFELFDLANVPNSSVLLREAAAGRIRLTPPPKPALEEKALFALLWNRNLRDFWRRELGEAFLLRLLRHVPYTWVVDPAPLPPHAAIPELGLTDWRQLKLLSQRERHLLLKVSGYSEAAWGARGVFLGSDLSREAWSAAVDQALAAFGRSPFVLQRYHRPRLIQASFFDFDRAEPIPMQGRVRLCPYYFVSGEGHEARAQLGGVLATICPADKKILHGMSEAILAPCSA